MRGAHIALGCFFLGAFTAPALAADPPTAKPGTPSVAPQGGGVVVKVTPETKVVLTKKTLTLTAEERTSVKAALKSGAAKFAADKDKTKLVTPPSGLSPNAARAYRFEAELAVAQYEGTWKKVEPKVRALAPRYLIDNAAVVSFQTSRRPPNNMCVGEVVVHMSYKNYGGPYTEERTPFLLSAWFAAYETQLAKLAGNATAEVDTKAQKFTLSDDCKNGEVRWGIHRAGTQVYELTLANGVFTSFTEWEYTPPED